MVTFCSQPLNYQSKTAAGHFNALHLRVARILQNPILGNSLAVKGTNTSVCICIHMYGSKIALKTAMIVMSSLVPRPSPAPVFDRLQLRRPGNEAKICWQMRCSQGVSIKVTAYNTQRWGCHAALQPLRGLYGDPQPQNALSPNISETLVTRFMTL